MPYYVIHRLLEAIDRTLGKGLSAADILILGIAYKKNVDDMRESPSLKLIELLEMRGAKVDYHDPYIPVIPVTREHADLAGRKSVALTPEAIAGYDAVLISTDHDNVDYAAMVKHAKVVVDTRNVCGKAGIVSDKVFKA